MTLLAAEGYQQYRVPKESGTALVEPSLSELASVLSCPRNLLQGSGIEFCGKPLDLVRSQAREEVVGLAQAYTARYRDVPGNRWTADSCSPIVLSGHQPELFHPGVWFKNFLLSRLATHSGAIAINFLVDNDLCRSAAIRVPGKGASQSIVAQSVPFDTQRDSVPWELRLRDSADCWNRFPDAVAGSLLPTIREPLLAQLWPDATEAVRESNRIGLAIAQARHQLEGRVGLQTLEVPLSQLVSTRAFARFSIQLLGQLPRFQDVYNEQLLRYRTAHRIRSRAHPVPALEQQHGWLEAPWWVYRAEAPHRQRMWVRVLNDQLVISDRAGWQAVVEGRLDCDGAATQWLDLLADGVCLRPRALLTTMYLRLIVSDLFIHGIGGGKYDQLTDAIVQDFFGVQPPPMTVATATMRLPLGNESVQDLERTAADIRRQRERIWLTRYHADQLAESLNSDAQELAERKRNLIANIPERGEKWKWHREMTEVNRRLSEAAAAQAESAKLQIEQLLARQRQQRIVLSRDYSFCLFPLEFIVERLKDLAATS